MYPDSVPDETPNADRLIHEIYPQLRETARRLLRCEREGHTLQPTALVHEAFIRLFGRIPAAAMAQRSFLALAAHQMRHVLIDHGRKHGSLKRGRDFTRVSLQDANPGLGFDWDSLADLNRALERLGESDPRALHVVELKFFAGFTSAEAAEVLNVSTATVDAAWHYARLWLFRELTTPPPASRLPAQLNENRLSA